jgi:hypothetical protein
MLQRLQGQYQNYALLLFFGFSFFLFGFTSGILKSKLDISEAAPGLEFVKDSGPDIPLLIFQKIENGVLYGHNKGIETRIIVGPKEEEIVALTNGDFSFSVIEILPNLSQIPAPEGMLFAASKRGTKFWALDAPEAALITPKNRIFFRSKEEAEVRGFTAGAKE